MAAQSGEQQRIWDTVGPTLQRLEKELNFLRDENRRIDGEAKGLKLEVRQLERIIGMAVGS